LICQVVDWVCSNGAFFPFPFNIHLSILPAQPASSHDCQAHRAALKTLVTTLATDSFFLRALFAVDELSRFIRSFVDVANPFGGAAPIPHSSRFATAPPY
jgi:hypothetical protein